jgi:hypothetical protein
MPSQGRYLFIAAMDVEPAKEGLFNEVYDQEHVPSLIKVPGLISVARFRREPLTMSIGGELKTIDFPDEPRYAALYEVEGPDVMSTAAWGKAVEEGRWPAQVRPYTKNRKHTLWRRL